METVYADSLILLNTAIDYLLLLCAGKLCALPLRRRRMALGALWGGVYALLSVLWPSLFALVTVKLFAGALAVVIAFGFGRRTIRATTAFFAVSAAFAGAVYAAAHLAGRPVGPGLYLPVTPRILLLSFAVCYTAVSLIFRHAGRRAERKIDAVEITSGGRRVQVHALEDSGNELTDPLTGDRVLVVGAGALAPLFDDPAPLSMTDPLEALEAFDLQDGAPRFRLLPYSAVGTERALLLCFTPDSVSVNGKSCAGVAVAVSPNALAPDGEYQAII